MGVIVRLIAIVFGGLFKKLIGLASWLLGLAGVVFTSSWLFGLDLASAIFEQILKLIIVVLNGVDITFTAFDFSQYISGIPDEIRSVIGLIGLDTATSILVGAVIIRFGLKLIPFVGRMFG